MLESPYGASVLPSLDSAVFSPHRLHIHIHLCTFLALAPLCRKPPVSPMNMQLPLTITSLDDSADAYDILLPFSRRRAVDISVLVFMHVFVRRSVGVRVSSSFS